MLCDDGVPESGRPSTGRPFCGRSRDHPGRPSRPTGRGPDNAVQTGPTKSVTTNHRPARALAWVDSGIRACRTVAGPEGGSPEGAAAARHAGAWSAWCRAGALVRGSSVSSNVAGRQSVSGSGLGRPGSCPPANRVPPGYKAHQDPQARQGHQAPTAHPGPAARPARPGRWCCVPPSWAGASPPTVPTCNAASTLNAS